MGHPSQQVDVESLGDRRRRRGCLDVFFTLSIIFLFVALTAVTTFGVMAMMEMKKHIGTSGPHSEEKMLQQCETQNVAYLTTAPISRELRYNSTMQFKEETPVGSNFNFDPDQHSLAVRREGNYLVSVDLKVTCTSACGAGLLRVQVGEKLTCDVKLPSNVNFMTYKCSTVTQLSSSRFLTKVFVPQDGLPNWELDVTRSGIGLCFTADM